MKKTYLSLCVSAAVASMSLAAQESEPTSSKTLFDRVVISASQNDQKLSEVDGTVNVIDDKDVQKDLVDSVGDLFKYTPSVTAGGGRQGESSINIRGIDGNRVLISVDGVKQAKNLSWGSTSSSRNLIDVNTLKQVEVVPGPGSSLYGSDALGGMVYYKTKEPSDVFTAEGDGFGGSIRTYYDDSNASFSQNLSVAGRSGDTEAMIIYTFRDREETRTHGGNSGTGPDREEANPSEGRDNSLLAKVNVGITDNQTLKFTAEYAAAKDDILELSSSNANASYDDHEKRYRVSAEYTVEQETALFDETSLKVDWQETNTDQYQAYTSPRFGNYTYHGEYDETVNSIDLKFKKELNTGGIEHKIQYGFDHERILFEQYRTSNLSGSNRSMPRSESTSIAFYLQDQISFAESGLTVTPGIRFDSYEVDAKPDAAYLASNPGDPSPDTNEDDQLTVKLGATYDINDEVMVFAQYAQGFKSPDMDQMFANYGRHGAYNFISNPDLKPETSDSIEVGIRFDNPVGSLEVLAFYNDYENFIEEVTLPHNPTYPYGEFQQQNLADVKIKGFELKGAVNFEEISDSMRGFTAQAALAYADGESTDNGETNPLNSISPLNAVIGVSYDAPKGNWGSELTLTAAKGKDASDVTGSDPFLPAGYGIVDLTAYYNLNKDIRIDAGVFNLTDKEYWTWETARRRQSSHTGLTRFSEPDRHFRVGLNWKF